MTRKPARKYPTYCRDVACYVSAYRIDEPEMRGAAGKDIASNVSTTKNSVGKGENRKGETPLFHDDRGLPG